MAHQNNALFKFFVKGQFNHSPPVRMFSWHSSSYSINKIHEVILPLTTEINYISFKKLLFLKIITKTYKHCKQKFIRIYNHSPTKRKFQGPRPGSANSYEQYNQGNRNFAVSYWELRIDLQLSSRSIWSNTSKRGLTPSLYG